MGYNYIPLEKGGAFHLNKLESLSPKDDLCQVWLKLAMWFLRRRWKCEMFTTTPMPKPTTKTTDKFCSENVSAGDTESIKKLMVQYFMCLTYIPCHFQITEEDSMNCFYLLKQLFHLHVLSHTQPKTFIFQKMFSYLLR